MDEELSIFGHSPAVTVYNADVNFFGRGDRIFYCFQVVLPFYEPVMCAYACVSAIDLYQMAMPCESGARANIVGVQLLIKCA